MKNNHKLTFALILIFSIFNYNLSMLKELEIDEDIKNKRISLGKLSEILVKQIIKDCSFDMFEKFICNLGDIFLDALKHEVNQRNYIDQFFSFIINQDEDNIKKLIKLNININALDDDMQSSLVYAIKYFPKGLDLFIEAGSNLNQIDKFGDSVLIIAVKKNLPDIVKKLVDKGTKLYVKDSQGKTAIDIAKDLGLENIIQILSSYEN